MYRTTDPRFRRRLNELGQTLESANETAQSNLYIFSHSYISPCLSSIGSCFTTCIDASCPSLNLSANQRQRARARGRARSRGRAELSFDFYDDWDEEGETDGLLGGWGNDEFDRLVAGSGAGSGGGGYGTVGAQPGRQRGMSYPKERRRKSTLLEGQDALTGAGLFGRLFGKGKGVKYKPSAADLQEHPGARRLAKDPEGEALLEEDESSAQQGRSRRHTRARSDTVGSRETQDSFSSRGEIFPSDEEDDAIPLDDEFAMVLERRNTGTHSGPETESSSNKTRSLKRGKRPSTGSRVSSRRTLSSRSTRSSTGKRVRSRGNSSAAQTPVKEEAPRGAEDLAQEEIEPPTLEEITQEDAEVAKREEEEVERRRLEAQRVAEERGLADEQAQAQDEPKPEESSSDPEPPTTAKPEEPSQLPSPSPTPDEEKGKDPDPQPAQDEQRMSEHDEHP